MPLPAAPTEYAEVDSNPLYWWIEVDWTPLLDGAELRGRNTVIPHSPGSYVNPRRLAETEYVCEGVLFGDRTREGVELGGDLAACREQLRDHLAYLRDEVCSPLAPSSPLRTFVLHGDPAWEGDVIIDRHLGLARVSPVVFRVVFRVTVPAGELVEVGS